MTVFLDTNFHMWFVLLLMAVVVVFYVRERVSLEVTSIGMLTSLLLFGQIFPLPDANGHNQLDVMALLAGFSNPSLIAVLALLVMGQAMIQTNALKFVTSYFAVTRKEYIWFAIVGTLIFVLIVSAFLNNTPLVVIAIPLIQVLARSIGTSESRFMIPLSYAAILGGMTTLIGSSTNLLVNSAVIELGYTPLKFFDFVVPGSMLAAIGLLYVVFLLPYLLPERQTMVEDLADNKKEFVAELDITGDSPLVGVACEEGRFDPLGDLNVKLIQRGGQLILPPFEGHVIQAHDIIIVTATRDSLTEILSKYPGFLLSEEEARVIDDSGAGTDETGEKDSGAISSEPRLLAEVMITPASRMIDMSLDHVSFHKQFGTIVLGIQRRARVVRRRLGRIRLEPGDVLLVAGRKSMVDSLRENSDFIVLSGSKRDLPVPRKAPVAGMIFLCTIGMAASGILSIPAAAIMGAVAMVATDCLNFRQAARAMDRRIFVMVGSMLALGTALQATGAARFIAESMLYLPFAESPIVMIAMLFLIVAFATNVLTNNACAILFTPIALNLAGSVRVDPAFQTDIAFIFALTVIFAANCSFASPIGYQTNLLVMGPGHYRFRDFVKAGVPLVFLLWAAYILILKYYFQL